MLWTYADRQADGSYRRIGGGAYDPATDTYGQGAFNADDISRAAVVYLRHWERSATRHSRGRRTQLLRGLTYLQTATGPNAGNFVLWMQPDGTLNPSADPKELPDPSDSDASYWLARTVWALGEGYAVFRRPTLLRRLPAGTPRSRGGGAGSAGPRPVRPVPHGRRARVAGLAHRRRRGRVRRGCARPGGLCRGPAAPPRPGRAGPVRRRYRRMCWRRRLRWPFGACCPGRCPARTGTPGRPRCRPRSPRPRRRWATGACCAPRSPTPPPSPVADDCRWAGQRLAPRSDRPYADRLRRRRSPAGAPRGRAARPQAARAFVAAWYFGANAPARPIYDPATGPRSTASPPTAVNRNSGAESTIHGPLSMLALDAHPAVRGDRADLVDHRAHLVRRSSRRRPERSPATPRS